jgi:hypothetical protein
MARSETRVNAELDRANIISIDVCHFIPCQRRPESDFLFSKIHHDVRPDSMLILHAAQVVVEEEGFDDLLDSVRGRVDEIESLHRTRELTVRTICYTHE